MILYPLGKVIVLGSSLGLMSSTALGSHKSCPGFQYQAWVPPCGAGLKSSRKWLVTFITTSQLYRWAYIVYIARSVVIVAHRFIAGQNCWLFFSSPSAACMVSSGTVKASQLLAPCQPQLGFPMSCGQVCHSISNRVLAPSSGGQPRAMSTARIVFGESLGPPRLQLKGKYPTSGFYLTT